MSSNPADADTEAGAETGVTADERDAPPDWSIVNWGVIVGLTALTLVGIALSSGAIDAVVTATGTGSGTVAVPLYVYLYSGFGALGYVFTKLMVQFDRYTEWTRIEQLVGMAMRLPAAWILASGVYLFLGNFAPAGTGGGARLTAGVAFLVGLYVNVALKALGSIADRILGRTPRRAE